jgi:hypothetical protein
VSKKSVEEICDFSLRSRPSGQNIQNQNRQKNQNQNPKKEGLLIGSSPKIIPTKAQGKDQAGKCPKGGVKNEKFGHLQEKGHGD